MDRISSLAVVSDVNRYTVAISLAILYYDYLLTVSAEVKSYWFAERFSWVTFFFFTNRYAALLGHIPVAFEFFSQLSEQRCRQLQLYHQLYCVVVTSLVLILLIMRTYAMYERSCKVLSLLVGVLFTAGGVSAWAIVTAQHLPDPTSTAPSSITGCDLSLSAVQGRYIAAGWCSILVMDTVVFSLTLYKRLQVGRTVDKGLFALMIRDGTMYYGILVVLYICDILTFLVADSVYNGIVVTFTNVLSSTLMSRLMLNIRDPEMTGRTIYISTFTVSSES